MTFQIRVKTGPRVGNEFVNSYVDLWVAREGQPSEHVVRWGPYNLSASPGEKYGKVWLSPYQTSKSSAQVHPVAYTWYDELIISRTKIADPGVGTTGGSAGGSVPAPNTAPTVSLTSPAGGASFSSPATVNLAATAADVDGAVSKVELYRNDTLIASAPGSASGTYTYADTNLAAG